MGVLVMVLLILLVESAAEIGFLWDSRQLG